MPWVRLHGTKDYIGMALHIKEEPEFRCTINLVPSLLHQLLDYTDRDASDRHLDVSRMPVDGMEEADLHYLLDNFFMANVDSMVRPFPRYYDLYMKRGFGTDNVDDAAPRFNKRDLRDLQIWSNLTWIHELVFEQDKELKEFRNKGQDWTESERDWLLDKQLEILKQVVPLHRELMESGQVELTTTPYYHPILPLLWDKKLAHQAMPGCTLPKHLEPYEEDAKLHLKRAVEYHKKLFGKAPKGMWPSEGSVAQEVLGSIADVGIEWIATDEEILAHSTNGWISRDSHGHMRHPEMLYRPWEVTGNKKKLQIIFRDHAMSDLIGFHYQRSDPEHAANDLISRVEGIGRACESHNGGRPAFVPIILDGENCWEYYPDGGVKFLRSLYQRCAQSPMIRPQTVSDYLEKHPATDHIAHLFAGSWISHNFGIWIGHHEDHTAWDLLHETREFLKRVTDSGKGDAKALERAWEELYIAEGSDWFWWFGDDHSSAQDSLFDQLFRRHLQNVYTLLGEEPPNVLDRPITTVEHRSIHTDPTVFLPVKIDGRRTYFEWISAGHYVSGNERGTMTLVTEGTIREIFFGFDERRLLIRVDTAGDAAEDLASLDELRIGFYEPRDTEIRITGLKAGKPQAKLLRKGRAVARSQVEVCVDHILELSVTFKEMKLEPEMPIHFYVEAVVDDQVIDQAPQEGTIELKTPTADFELRMWQA